MNEYERLQMIANELYGGLTGLAEVLGKTPAHFYPYKKYGSFGKKQLVMLDGFGISQDFITKGIGWWFSNNKAGKELAGQFRKDSPYKYDALLARKTEEESADIPVPKLTNPENVIIITTFDHLRLIMRELWNEAQN
jgi:hypothetical protein